MTSEPNSTRTPVLNSPANETAPAFSADGDRLACVADASGRDEVYVVPYPVSGPPVRVSRDGGREPVWSRDGTEIFFRRGRGVYAARVNGAHLADPVLLFSGDYDLRRRRCRTTTSRPTAAFS